MSEQSGPGSATAELEGRVRILKERVTALADAVRVLARGLEDIPTIEPASGGRPTPPGKPMNCCWWPSPARRLLHDGRGGAASPALARTASVAGCWMNAERRSGGLPPGYPAQYEQEVMLGDGRRVLIRC